MEQTQYANGGKSETLTFVATRNQADDGADSAPTHEIRITLFDKLILRICHYFSISKISEHLIKVGIGVVVLVLLNAFLSYLHLGKVHDYAGITTQVVIAYQIVRSARYSLTLPTIALVLGLTMASSISGTGSHWGYSQVFFGHMAAVGLLGLLAATLMMVDEKVPLSAEAVKQLNLLR